jgi:hypothetical protein
MKKVYFLVISSLLFVALFAQKNYVELSHYLFPEFTQGVILMKSGAEIKALYNYNSLTEEMIYIDKEKKYAIAKEVLDNIDTVFIGDRKFCILDNKFIELIHHSGFDLFIEHRCSIDRPGKPAGYGGTSKTAAIDSYSSFSPDGLTYELKLPDGYKVKPYIRYYLKKAGEYNKFSNLRQLKKLYNTKKDIFNSYKKKHDVKFENQESIIQFIGYLESN